MLPQLTEVAQVSMQCYNLGGSIVFDCLNALIFIPLKSFYSRHLIELGICLSRSVYFLILRAHLPTPSSHVWNRRCKDEGVNASTMIAVIDRHILREKSFCKTSFLLRRGLKKDRNKPDERTPEDYPTSAKNTQQT